MAIFKLGAVVTAIVGSIGGTTFKRGKNNLIVMNKSFGGSKNKLLQNAQLNPIARIFKLWTGLDSAIKTDWNNAAAIFLFPDKFGVEKHLSGRELFIKLNIQLLPVGIYIEDPVGITSDIGDVTFSNVLVDVSNQTLTFDTFTTGMFTLFTVQAEINLGPLASPVFSRREIIYNSQASGSTPEEIGAQFFGKFPYYDNNYNARLYFTLYNVFGFKSVPTYINALNV
jgi:hypothetical protein